jgi:hypothetical protein
MGFVKRLYYRLRGAIERRRYERLCALHNDQMRLLMFMLVLEAERDERERIEQHT